MIIKLTKRLRFINAVIVIFLCNCTNSLDISLNMRKNQKDLPVKEISSIEINSTDNDKKIKEPELPLESKQIQDINENLKKDFEENIEKVDFTILVLGQFESGKTTFCNLLTGRSIEDLPSTENFIMSVAKVGNKKIRIIDSPDYFLGEEKGPANKSLGLRDLVRENYDNLSKYVPNAIVFICPYFPRFDKISDPYIDARLQLDFESYKDQTFLLVTCDKKMEVKDFQFQGFLKSPIRIPAERRFLLSKTDLEAGKFLSIDSFLERVQDIPKSDKSIWDTIKEYESPAEKLMKNMQSMEPLKKDCSNSKNYNYSNKHYYGEKSYHNSSNKFDEQFYYHQYGLSDHDKVINYIKELINEKNKCPIELKEKLKDVLEFVEREEDVDYVKCEWMERIPKVMLWSENEFISYYIKISSKSNKNLNREWRSQASGVILKGSEAGGRDYS